MANTEIKDVTNIIEDNMMRYSHAVLTDRAIPTVQDGMKPVARRIMFTLQNKNITKLTKSMNVTGLISAVHPHGTTYDAIVGMVQDDNWQVPLIDGHGNFSQYSSRDLQAGADRYTEIKISDFGKEMTKLIPAKVVPQVPNYDGTIQMPLVIPVTFPLILAQSQSGIGVGFSSSTLSYNMKEIAQVISEYIETGVVNPIYPDFPSKGYLIENEEELQAGLTGKSSFTLEAKIESVDKQTIRVTEFPYGVKYEAVIDKIIALVKAGKLQGITDVKDLNDFNGTVVEIYTRKNVKHDKLIEDLLKKTPLRSNVNSNPNMIDINNGNPRIYGFKEVVEIWLDWRKNVYKNQLQKEINNIENKLYNLRGLDIIKDNLDEVIDTIRSSKRNDIIKNLVELTGVEEKQAEFIVSMKLYNINKDFISDKISEMKSLEKESTKLYNKVKSDKKLLNDISKEISDIADKFGVDRQTIIKEN